MLNDWTPDANVFLTKARNILKREATPAVGQRLASLLTSAMTMRQIISYVKAIEEGKHEETSTPRHRLKI